MKPDTGLAICGGCGATIFWARTRDEKPIRLDTEPDPRGTVRLLGGGTAEVLDAQTIALLSDRSPLYTNHLFTCPKAGGVRRPPPAPTPSGATMTTQTRNSPFKGQARQDNGGPQAEMPSEDTHEARVVALIDLGTHRESFQGGEEKDVRQCQVVFELDERLPGTRDANHVIGVQYTLSLHEKASLRKLAEAILNNGAKYGPEAIIDYELLLGQPCTVQVAHKTVQTDKGERKYARAGVISAVSKKHAAKVFAPGYPLTAWYVGDDIDLLPDWLPRVFGEPVKDKVRRCQQLCGTPAAAAAEDDEATPF
jgi:hypothetical protein